jgi:hypothetical protein
MSLISINQAVVEMSQNQVVIIGKVFALCTPTLTSEEPGENVSGL